MLERWAGAKLYKTDHSPSFGNNLRFSVIGFACLRPRLIPVLRLGSSKRNHTLMEDRNRGSDIFLCGKLADVLCAPLDGRRAPIIQHTVSSWDFGPMQKITISEMLHKEGTLKEL